MKPMMPTLRLKKMPHLNYQKGLNMKTGLTQILLPLTVLIGIAGCSSKTDTRLDSDMTGFAPEVNYACYEGQNDACDLRIYQVMVESFVNGDNKTNYDQGYGTSHHKGDLQGVIDSLDYIKSLNVNAIWMTPVFDSCKGEAGNIKLDATGYFACDYFNVDPNFGSNEKLKELIDKAHEKGLFVLLDGVFGHTNKAQLKSSPTGKMPKLKAGDPGYPGQLVVYPDAGSEAFFTEVATYWIAEYKIDGWRLDQAYQIPVDSWANIRQAVEAASAKNRAEGSVWGTLGYMVGEVWNSAGYITETAYGTETHPALKSAFNFPLRYGLVQALAVEESGTAGDATKLNADWNKIENYPPHAMPNLMLGNHDLVRFADLIQRGHLSDTIQRHKAAFSFMAAYSGPITFYYGEEIADEVPDFSYKVSSNCVERGLCDDHVARSSGKIEGVTDGVVLTPEQKALKSWLSKLMRVRSDNPALYNGRRTNLLTTSSLYADLKTYQGEQVVYVLNTADSDTTFDLNMSALKTTDKLVDLMTGEEITTSSGTTSVDVPALTGRLLKVE